MIKVERLNTMWVRPNHNVDTTIHQPASELALFVGDSIGIFNSPVDQASHQVCARTCTGDRGGQATSLGCRRDLRSRNRAEITDRKERDFLTIEH